MNRRRSRLGHLFSGRFGAFRFFRNTTALLLLQKCNLTLPVIIFSRLPSTALEGWQLIDFHIFILRIREVLWIQLLRFRGWFPRAVESQGCRRSLSRTRRRYRKILRMRSSVIKQGAWLRFTGGRVRDGSPGSETPSRCRLVQFGARRRSPVVRTGRNFLVNLSRLGWSDTAMRIRITSKTLAWLSRFIPCGLVGTELSRSLQRGFSAIGAQWQRSRTRRRSWRRDFLDCLDQSGIKSLQV